MRSAGSRRVAGLVAPPASTVCLGSHPNGPVIWFALKVSGPATARLLALPLRRKLARVLGSHPTGGRFADGRSPEPPLPCSVRNGPHLTDSRLGPDHRRDHFLAQWYHTPMNSATTTSDTTKAGEALIVKRLPRKQGNRVQVHGAGSSQLYTEAVALLHRAQDILLACRAKHEAALLRR